MNRKNILLLLIFILVIVAGGFFWFQKSKETNIPANKTNETGQVSDKTFEPVAGESDKVWFPVPELGIKIKVNKDIAPDLMYNASSGSEIASAGFTTKRLFDIAVKEFGHGTDPERGIYNCFIGGFSRYDMPKEEYVAMQEKNYGEGYVTPIDVDGYFIEYTTPQAPCTAYSPGDEKYNALDSDYEQYIVSNWFKVNFEDIGKSLQENVKRIK